jgi:hypothetical protein
VNPHWFQQPQIKKHLGDQGDMNLTYQGLQLAVVQGGIELA